MSNNNLLNQTPGLSVVEERFPRAQRVPNLATKVTGRNFMAVSLIVSLEAERTQRPLELRTIFGDDGSLAGMTVIEVLTGDEIDIPAGAYLVLLHDQTEAVLVDEQTFKQYFREI